MTWDQGYGVILVLFVWKIEIVPFPIFLEHALQGKRVVNSKKWLFGARMKFRQKREKIKSTIFFKFRFQLKFVQFRYQKHTAR